jgi:hypothetical protein
LPGLSNDEPKRAVLALPHGEFGRMIAGERVPFGWNAANRLMAIAGHSLLSHCEHVHNLPSSWGTLYQLTKAPDEALNRWLTDGTVHPELQHKDVKRLLRALREATPREAADHDFLDGEDARLICGDALDEALKLPAGCVAAIITDPPYGAGWLPLLGRHWQYRPGRLFPLGVNSINDGTLEQVDSVPIVRWTAVAMERSP